MGLGAKLVRGQEGRCLLPGRSLSSGVGRKWREEIRAKETGVESETAITMV